MNVHVLVKGTPFEGDEVISVFADHAKAYGEAQKRNFEESCEQAEFNEKPFYRFSVITCQLIK